MHLYGYWPFQIIHRNISNIVDRGSRSCLRVVSAHMADEIIASPHTHTDAALYNGSLFSPPQQRNSRVSEGNVNDQHQDFQRQLALVQEEKAEDHKRWSQQACQHRLLLQLLVLLCFVLGVLSQHYFPMDVSTDIFPTRSFQVDVSGVHDLVHAGVWGVLRAERKICLQQADGPLWSPARCRSFIFNLVYRAYNQKEETPRECFYIFGSCTEGSRGVHAASRVFWSLDFQLLSPTQV
jgi:hypothetical protein